MRAFCFGRALETARPDCHVILFKSQSRHSMTNLLQTFSLSHTQITRLNADLNEIVKPDQPFSTKVELKLSPRTLNHEADLPQYQVTARMLCHGTKSGSESESDQPLFTIELARRVLVLGKLGLKIHFTRAEFELNLGAERLVRLDDLVEIGIQTGDLGMGQGKGLQQVGHGMAAL